MKTAKKQDECSCKECDSHGQNEKADEMSNQREMLELNVLEMQIRQLEQQAMLVEQQIQEMAAINQDLEELRKAKKGQTMLLPFSRDIFIEAKIENPDSLLVHIGSKIFSRKSINGAKALVEKQKHKFAKANEEIAGEIEKILARISEIEKKLH